MATRLYKLDLALNLVPIMHQEPPEIEVRFANIVQYRGSLAEPKQFVVNQALPEGKYKADVEFLNKKNSDTRDGKDKAVIVDSIVLNGICSPRFVWQGLYWPCYPEPWLSQQQAQGKTPEPCLRFCNYISWNGTWTLDLSVPVFSWIHQVENLGSVYD